MGIEILRASNFFLQIMPGLSATMFSLVIFVQLLTFNIGLRYAECITERNKKLFLSETFKFNNFCFSVWIVFVKHVWNGRKEKVKILMWMSNHNVFVFLCNLVFCSNKILTYIIHPINRNVVVVSGKKWFFQV